MGYVEEAHSLNNQDIEGTKKKVQHLLEKLRYSYQVFIFILNRSMTVNRLKISWSNQQNEEKLQGRYNSDATIKALSKYISQRESGNAFYKNIMLSSSDPISDTKLITLPLLAFIYTLVCNQIVP